MDTPKILKEQCILTQLLIDAGLFPSPLQIANVGARESGNYNDLWRYILDGSQYIEHGFEPSSNGGVERSGSCVSYPVGLWNTTGLRPFYMNSNPTASSFLPYNQAFMDRLRYRTDMELRDIQRTEGVVDLPVSTLADWASKYEIDDLDFLKMNIQGGELAVLQEAGPLLDHVCGLFVEVSFAESYKGRPFFSDIDSYLRSRGFSFFDFIGGLHGGRVRSPITHLHLKEMHRPYASAPNGQLIEGHTIYFRDPTVTAPPWSEQDSQEFTKEIKLICLAEMFEQVEFAFDLLLNLEERCREHGRLDQEQALHQVWCNALEGYLEFVGERTSRSSAGGSVACRVLEPINSSEENDIMAMTIPEMIEQEKVSLQVRGMMLSLAAQTPPGRELIGAEVGVWGGGNASNYLRCLPIAKLFLIDPYECYENYSCEWVDTQADLDAAFAQAKELLAPYNDRIEWIRKSSFDAVGDLPDQLDFVYLDGNHTYEFVKKELELYWSKVRWGGVIGGHDYAGEVRDAVLDFLKACPDDKPFPDLPTSNDLYSLYVTPPPYCDWWIIKHSWDPYIQDLIMLQLGRSGLTDVARRLHVNAEKLNEAQNLYQPLAKFIPEYVKYRCLHLAEKHEQIGLFPGGKHSAWIARIVAGWLPKNKMVIFDDSVSEETQVEGYRCIPSDQRTDDWPARVILSSDAASPQLATRAQELFGDRLVDLYAGMPAGPYPKE